MTDESHPQAPAPTSPEVRKNPTLVHWGGWLGFLASSAGLAIFLLGCAGYLGPFGFYWLPLGLGALGMLLTVVGGVLGHRGVEQTAILASLFVNLFALVGGLLELALHQGWDIFFRASAL
jgi:hypothetical protein